MLLHKKYQNQDIQSPCKTVSYKYLLGTSYTLIYQGSEIRFTSPVRSTAIITSRIIILFTLFFSLFNIQRKSDF